MIIRDTVAIKSVGTYFKKQSDEISKLKVNLIKQIKNIENQYKGVDAINIINKLETIINDLNMYVENLNYYGEFMISLANHDSEILSETRKKIINIGVFNE